MRTWLTLPRRQSGADCPGGCITVSTNTQQHTCSLGRDLVGNIHIWFFFAGFFVWFEGNAVFGIFAAFVTLGNERGVANVLHPHQPKRGVHIRIGL